MNDYHQEPGKCQECGMRGIDVPYDTVISLTIECVRSRLSYGQFYICINPECNVAYYSDNFKITLDEVKVPIWFKNKKDKYIVCYCRNITLDDIINVIKKEKDFTVEQIVKYLKRDNIPTDCILKMPTGESCERLFIQAVEYVKRQAKNNGEIRK